MLLPTSCRLSAPQYSLAQRAACHSHMYVQPCSPIASPRTSVKRLLGAECLTLGCKQHLSLPGRRLRCPHAERSSRSRTDVATSVKLLRELAKAPPLRRFGSADGDFDASLDDRVHGLLSNLRAATSDGQQASSRNLGLAIWALGKLATPSSYRHALPLLRALTAPATLRDASNQTLSNALYGTALLFRSLSANSKSISGLNTSDLDSTTAAVAADAIRQAALALAAACQPRAPTFTEQDLGSTWWALATLMSSSPSFPPSFPSSSSSPSSSSPPQQQQHTSQLCSPSDPFPLPPGLLPALSSASTRLMTATKRGSTTKSRTTAATAPLPRGGRGAVAGAGAGAAAAGGGVGMGPRALSNVLWGAVRLGYYDGALVEAAVQLMKPQVQDMARTDPRALATSLWALAALLQLNRAGQQQQQRVQQQGVCGLLRAAAGAAAAHMQDFNDQALSNLMWAYGKTGLAPRRLLSAAAQELARRAPSMNLQSLSTCVWAFAALRIPSPLLLEAVGTALAGLGDGGGESAVMMDGTAPEKPAVEGCTAALAAATAAAEGCRDGVEVAAEATRMRQGRRRRSWRLEEAIERCEGRRTQAVSNLIWSYASLEVRHDPLLSALAEAAESLAGKMGGQELSNTMYGIARLLPDLAMTHPGVLQGLLSEVDRRLQPPPPPSSPTLPPKQLCRDPPCLASPTTSLGTANTNPIAAINHVPTTTTTTTAACPDDAASDGAAVAAAAAASAARAGLTARELALLSWSIAVLSPASPTLHRLLLAAAATGAVSAGNKDDAAGGGGGGGNDGGLLSYESTAVAAASVIVSEEDDEDDEEDGDTADGSDLYNKRDGVSTRSLGTTDPRVGGVGGVSGDGARELRPQHLYGLAQLYSANYAACLATAAAASAAATPATSGVGGRSVGVAGGSGGKADGCRGGGGSVVRMAAAAMRQAQKAAEAFGQQVPSSSSSDGSSSRAVAASAAAASAFGCDAAPAAADGTHAGAATGVKDGGGAKAEAEGKKINAVCGIAVKGESGGDAGAEAAAEVAAAEVEAEVVFGPLGTCPQLFRAARNAWYLNTTCTAPSGLQAAVAETLRSGGSDISGGSTGGSADAISGGGGLVGKVVRPVAEEVLSPDRMFPVDLLVLYDSWLVLLQVDGPLHYAVEVEGGHGSSGVVNSGSDASSGGRVVCKEGDGGGKGLRRLGETVLRDRLLQGALAACHADPDQRCIGSADPWVIESLLEQLQLPKEVSEVKQASAMEVDGDGDGNGGDNGGVIAARGVAAAVVSYAEWQDAGEDKWGGCLAPLLARATSVT